MKDTLYSSIKMGPTCSLDSPIEEKDDKNHKFTKKDSTFFYMHATAGQN